MTVEIKVPAMGESITEATIGQLLKPSGSVVKAEEEILELETDKVNQVLYAETDGVIEWIVSVDDTVTIGQVIGHIKEGQQSQAKPEPKKELEQTKIETKPSKSSEKSARVSKEDFLKEQPAVKKEPEPKKEKPTPKTEKVVTASQSPLETRTRMPKIRQVIAKRLVEVQQTTAMLTTFNEVDLTEVQRIRKDHKESFMKRHDCKLGLMSFFVKAASAALLKFPHVNSRIEGDEIVTPRHVSMSIAVSTDRGLVVPVLKNTEILTFAEIEKGIVDFAIRAREGRLAVDEFEGGSFTITNGGVFGSLLSTPIINAPQSAILGMHTISMRPMVIDGEIKPRPMMYLALSYDHRIVDGKEAVSFLVYMKKSLEDPANLLLDL